MDTNYASNSFKSKEEAAKEPKKIESVVKSPVKKKEPSKIVKFFRPFISDDVTTLRSYIWLDVIVPAVKKLILDIIKNGADVAIMGKASKASTSSNLPKVSYDKASQGGSTTMMLPRSTGNYFTEIIFNTREDAEEVLRNMRDLLRIQRRVTVHQMYDLAGVPCDFTWEKYGWMDLGSAEVISTQNNGEIGYMIRLPRAIPV